MKPYKPRLKQLSNGLWMVEPPPPRRLTNQERFNLRMAISWYRRENQKVRLCTP